MALETFRKKNHWFMLLLQIHEVFSAFLPINISFLHRLIYGISVFVLFSSLF